MTVPSRLLIVDDDLALCQVLARSLRRRGLEVSTAHDGPGALIEAELRQPDSITLDLRLGRDNGLHLIRDLLERCPQARIVLATGFASIATAVDAIRRGAWNYLPKPFDVDMLLHAFAYSPEQAPPATPPSRLLSLRQQGWEHQQRVLSECGGNISAAARLLGIDRRTLQRRLVKQPVRAR